MPIRLDVRISPIIAIDELASSSQIASHSSVTHSAFCSHGPVKKHSITNLITKFMAVNALYAMVHRLPYRTVSIYSVRLTLEFIRASLVKTLYQFTLLSMLTPGTFLALRSKSNRVLTGNPLPTAD